MQSRVPRLAQVGRSASCALEIGKRDAAATDDIRIVARSAHRGTLASQQMLGSTARSEQPLPSGFIRYTLAVLIGSDASMPKTTGSFNPDEYTTVAERIQLFYDAYPDGQIHTRLVSYEGGRV